MKITKYHIFFYLLLFWYASFCQQYTHYTDKEGLPSNHIYRITQDYQGFIWFITDKGIAKFNGTTFKTFTTKEGLQTNDIWDVRITKDNKLWFFSKASQLGYIEKDTVYTFPSVAENQILYPISINQSGNYVGFSDRKKHYFLKDKKWHFFKLPNDSVLSIEAVTHPLYKDYLIEYKKAIAHLRDTNNTVVKSFQLGAIIKDNFYRGQINDSLFCWVNDKRMILQNLNTTKVYNYHFEQLKTKFVRYNYANDEIIFSGLNFVTKLNKEYKFDSIYSIPEALKSHYSFIDKNKNLWSASFGNGVFFLPEAKRKAIYRLQNEKTGRLQWIENKLIVGVYNKGFYQYKPKTKEFVPYIKEKDFIFNAVHIDSLAKSYFITNTHVYIQNKNKTIIYPFYKIDKKFEFGKDLAYCNGYLYSNTSAGINIIDPANNKVVKEINLSGIRDIQVFDNVIYLATANGLKYIDNNSIKNVWNHKTSWNKPIVNLYKIDDKKMVICTDGFGAFITDLKKVVPLEGSDFLTVQDAFYKNDSLWLATNKGIWLYNIQKNDKQQLLKKYTTKNGLTTNLINAVTISHNDIIASSNNGIAIIPKKQNDADPVLGLYFERSYYNKQRIQDNKKYLYTFNNHVDINVSDINFSDEYQKISYQYKLEPIQKNWIQTSSNSLVFSDLSPNEYHLIIRSGKHTNSLSFSISPLWWQRPIAKIGFLLAGILSVTWFLLWYRKRELNKKTAKINTQKKLAEYELYALRSQMNPHFVFNSLNAVQYYLNDNKIELSEKYLVKFSKLIRMFFEFSRNEKISLKEEIKLLKTYLEIEKLRFGDKLNYAIHIDKELDNNRSIPAMLLQPIVENAVNHGIFHKQSSGLIQISFIYLDQTQYKVVIEDDGIGREKSKKIKKNSLKKHESKSTQILEDRINLLNQSKHWKIHYEISDINQTENTGTRVSIIFEQL